jgi:endophilin-A
MISHGEDLQHAARQSGSSSGQGAKLGEMLERFGRGRCRVSSVQEQYANRLGDGYMAGMENAKEVVSDYQAQRKKLDSRRYVLIVVHLVVLLTISLFFSLALDAIQRKMNSSKKDTSALEEELEIATAR